MKGSEFVNGAFRLLMVIKFIGCIKWTEKTEKIY